MPEQLLDRDEVHATFIVVGCAGPAQGMRGANVVSIDSGAGLSNATLQQRLVPVRLFYDFLVEEGLRDSNPVGRGRYTSRGRGGISDRSIQS